jgi:hypothetical protein
LQGTLIAIAVSTAALIPAVAPGTAGAASPILEFVTPGFPVTFTAAGGEVTAELADFDSVVHCTGSRGEGAVTGARSTLSIYDFTGCSAEGGSKNGEACESAGANAEEIRSPLIEAELVFIDQATHSVGVLLDPHGGVYLSFECGGEGVKAFGPFLSRSARSTRPPPSSRRASAASARPRSPTNTKTMRARSCRRSRPVNGKARRRAAPGSSWASRSTPPRR